MAEVGKGSYEVGFGKPPGEKRFGAGQSGNPKGRPRGAKNFATAIRDELQMRITITENGKRKRISKRQVIAKHLVNKAAAGDLKAMPLLFNEARPHEGQPVDAIALELFGQAEDQRVIDSAIRRIRSAEHDRSDAAPPSDPPGASEESAGPRKEVP
jgi:hypothetical protein